MVENLLATFLHISDLHIGDLDSANDARLNAVAKDWWALWKAFDGYLGHHASAMAHLDETFGQLKEDERAQLIVTGDITQCGGITQFQIARDYIEREITLNPGNTVGLHETNILRLTIPGNHDHWPGRLATNALDLVMYGIPTSGFRSTFPDLPIPKVTIPLGNNCRIVFVGIDTDADVREHLPATCRVTARGKFVSQLEKLEGILGPSKDDEIRVLLLHHSPQCVDFLGGVQNASLRALNRFIEQYEICVLLTGHVHQPAGEAYKVKYRGNSWNVLEARCGTTTQRDEVPLGWNPRPLPQNTLLVHRLYETGGAIIWRTNLYRRGLRGFVDHGPLRLKGRRKGNEGVVVWPRS